MGSGGKFEMGTDRPFIPADLEGPARQQHVEPFFIDRFEVSVGQYAAYVATTQYVTEAEKYGWSFVYDGVLSEPERNNVTQWTQNAPWWAQVQGAYWMRPEGGDSSVFTPPRSPYSQPIKLSALTIHTEIGTEIHLEGDESGIASSSTSPAHRLDEAVGHMSWNDAAAFCASRRMRLPSEREWEYASRGGKARRLYSWGNKLLPHNQHRANIWQGEFPLVNTAQDGYRTMAPIYAFKPNGFGLYNTIGNAWEWVSDASNINGEDKIKKGGSFMCHESYCYRYRNAARTGSTPDSSAMHLGFRCARSIPQDHVPADSLVLNDDPAGLY